MKQIQLAWVVKSKASLKLIVFPNHRRKSGSGGETQTFGIEIRLQKRQTNRFRPKILPFAFFTTHLLRIEQDEHTRHKHKRQSIPSERH